MTSRFAVVMRTEAGDPVILDTTRRFRGALNVLDSHVESKRKQLLRHGHGRVASGPDRAIGDEVYAESVILITPEFESTTTYAVLPLT